MGRTAAAGRAPPQFGSSCVTPARWLRACMYVHDFAQPWYTSKLVAQRRWLMSSWRMLNFAKLRHRSCAKRAIFLVLNLRGPP